MHKENLCFGCELCCRKYKIYLFPKEANSIAKKLKISSKKFVEKYLDYYFEFFSVPQGSNEKSNLFEVPKNIFPNSKKYFLFYSLSLKQKNDACIFLKNKECTIYSVRPLICRLFPDFKFYGEEFDFCKLDKQKRNAGDPRKFYPFLQKYLQEVKGKGFRKVWKFLPLFVERNIWVVVDGHRKKQTKDQTLYLKTIL